MSQEEFADLLNRALKKHALYSDLRGRIMMCGGITAELERSLACRCVDVGDRAGVHALFTVVLANEFVKTIQQGGNPQGILDQYERQRDGEKACLLESRGNPMIRQNLVFDSGSALYNRRLLEARRLGKTSVDDDGMRAVLGYYAGAIEAAREMTDFNCIRVLLLTQAEVAARLGDHPTARKILDLGHRELRRCNRTEADGFRRCLDNGLADLGSRMEADWPQLAATFDPFLLMID